jgi:L-iditol 2-dehydrogenase
MKMKAWVLHGIGDLRPDDIAAPTPKRGEVLVRVKAAGICSSDISRVYETGAYHYPIVLGHEFSGVSSDGRRVGVFPLIPCLICESCKAGHYETCSNYSYIGSRRDGAFAEYVAVPGRNLIALPDDLTFEEASLLEPAAVALHAVKQVNLRKVQSAAVVGDGVIGQLAVRWLRVYGVADVDVFGRGDKPSPCCCDACIEAVGSADALRRCIEITKPGGQIILVGNPKPDFNIDRMLYWQILRKQLSVKGSWNSRYPSDWRETLDHAGALQLGGLISHRYAFDELGKAFEMLRAKRERHGKVIVLFDQTGHSGTEDIKSG